MEFPAIETNALDFSYSHREPLIREVDLRVPRGAVFGILGPNGAGKSTLMKLLLGLLTPTRGQVHLLGELLTDRALALFSRIGIVIEEPHLYQHLTGRENLRVFCDYRSLPYGRTEEVLKLVGLQGNAGKLVRHYSTGMKQRLAIAQALLPDPDLLILDEPTNGLDPQGIAEVRRLVQDLHRQHGKTIALSSHILSEVEQVCTHVGILHEGQLRFQGALKELKEHFFQGGRLLLEVDDPQRAAHVIGEPPAVTFASESEISLRIGHRGEIPRIIDALRAAGIAVYQVRIAEDRLEDYFLEVLKREETQKH